MIEEDAAEALNDRSDQLAVDNKRIDRHADILDRDIVEDLDGAGPRVDRDIGGMRAVAEGQISVEVGSVRPNLALPSRRHACASAGRSKRMSPSCDVTAPSCQRRSFAARPMTSAAKRISSSVKFRTPIDDGVAASDGAAAGKGAESFREIFRRCVVDLNTVHADPHRIGRKLRQRGLQALSDHRAAGEDRDGAVRFKRQARVFLRPAAGTFDKTSQSDAMMPAVDLLAVEAAKPSRN